jgi:hypothetical protein
MAFFNIMKTITTKEEDMLLNNEILNKLNQLSKSHGITLNPSLTSQYAQLLDEDIKKAYLAPQSNNTNKLFMAFSKLLIDFKLIYY